MVTQQQYPWINHGYPYILYPWISMDITEHAVTSTSVSKQQTSVCHQNRLQQNRHCSHSLCIHLPLPSLHLPSQPLPLPLRSGVILGGALIVLTLFLSLTVTHVTQNLLASRGHLLLIRANRGAQVGSAAASDLELLERIPKRVRERHAALAHPEFSMHCIFECLRASGRKSVAPRLGNGVVARGSLEVDCGAPEASRLDGQHTFSTR